MQEAGRLFHLQAFYRVSHGSFNRLETTGVAITIAIGHYLSHPETAYLQGCFV